MNNIEINVMQKIKFLTYMLSAAVLASSILFSAIAYAGPGHDHGDEAPVAAGEASPRVVMESELFEAVGVCARVISGRMRLALARALPQLSAASPNFDSRNRLKAAGSASGL